MKQGMQIKNLSFAFSEASRLFFKNVNFEILPKKIYFLKGVNGSGKSTLFRLLQGNVYDREVLKGALTVDGQTYDLESEKSTLKLRALVHAVQQDYTTMIADRFNFEENLRFAHLPEFPTLKSLPAFDPIPELVKRFNIDVKQPVCRLSGGQRQILAILMALQKHPALLLLDEPTAALDPVNTATVLAFLHELVALADITILIITHDQSVIEAYADNNFFNLLVDRDTFERTIACPFKKEYC